MKRILLPVFVLFAVQAFAQGGETCGSAQLISSLPFVDTGNTSTAVDNYYASCSDGSDNGGKDRVYKYVCGSTTEYIDISVCVAVTNYDSKLMVYENVCSGTTYACQDDGCQSPAYTNAYNSTITNLMLSPGNTYFIVVDGYNTGASGNYQINVSAGAGIPPVIVPFVDSTSKLPTSVFHSGNAIGVADMNNDGLDDIVRPQYNNVMYVEYQQPGGSFTELSFPAETIGDPWGMCIGDVNNDGFNDVLYGENNYTYILTSSSAGTDFNSVNVTTATGSANIFVQGANFFDVNNDGDLDAFVCNDVAMPHIYVGDGAGGWDMDQSLIPMATVPSSDNSGNYASIWSDVNNDDYPDLFITHCRQFVSSGTDARRIDQIFLNNGDYTYTQDITNFTGLRSGAQGWSSDFADFDNDGDLDCIVLQYDVNSLLLENNGSGVFTNVYASSGMAPTTSYFGMNVVCEDFDNNGYIDIFISGQNHHVMYLNNGDFTFTEDVGGLVYSTFKITSQGIGDLNHDGKMDIYASYCDIYNSPSSRNDKLFLNKVSNGNHFITFRLQGVASNRAGIGAKIKLYGPWGVQVREVRAGEAYGVNNSFMKHFGMGTATMADSVVVYWPSGQVDHMIDLPADAFITMVEGDHLLTTNKQTLKTDVRVFPNPTSGMLTIDVPMPGQGSILIRDLSGRVVYQTKNVERYNAIDMSVLGSGVYTYEITTPTGKSTGKVVKQ